MRSHVKLTTKVWCVGLAYSTNQKLLDWGTMQSTNVFAFPLPLLTANVQSCLKKKLKKVLNFQWSFGIVCKGLVIALNNV